MILVLNMIDEARARGVDIDIPGLAGGAGHSGDRGGRDGGTRARRAARRADAGGAAARRGRAPASPHLQWADDMARRFRTDRADVARPLPGVAGPRRARAADRRADPRCSCSTSPTWSVGVLGAQTLVGLLEDGLFGTVRESLGARRRGAHPVAVRPRLPRRRLRPHHDGPDLRHRHRAAGRHDVLPRVRHSSRTAATFRASPSSATASSARWD